LTTPRATYRLQLTPELTFDKASEVVPYLAELGISHVYCSPILQAAPGSAHGYDVVDPTRISEELGGREGFERFAGKAKEHALGLIVDVVPNHMATAGRANPWWWDVLLNGKDSRYVDYFDVDWKPTTSSVRDKIVLGVLGDRYGHELTSGALTLVRYGDDTVVRYKGVGFPIAPASLAGIDIESLNQDPAALDALLEQQHYRLEYWRSAQEELNYRRFFTVDSLIGLRVENEKVFEDSHRLLLDLVKENLIDGLRIDHVDGLRDPAAYLGRLRAAAPDAYIVVEKILARDEELRESWPVQGTTGYEFIGATDALFVDPESEAAMTALYHAFSGETQPYHEVARSARLEIMNTELGPDLERLSAGLVEICDADFHHRDRTRREVQDAIREVAAAFHVYRGYVPPATDEDRKDIQAAIDEAARRHPDIDPELLALIRDLLAGEGDFTASFQQFTPAVMAKGLEDTAFYRYHRLVSLNEVGGDPGTFGRSVDAFHEWCANATKRPESMLTLSTHDTKRSADVRARLDLLSEIAGDWEQAVRRWAEHNEQYRVHGYPDRNLEYLLYQTLVGAWPLDVERLKRFLQKAAREAKVHTSWINPVPGYEDAVAQFATSIMSDSEFMTDLETFIGRNQLVARGRLVSLAQTVLLLTAPGVPDIYQGTELWALSLVDPDNRASVDFDARARLLREATRDDSSMKLWAMARLLRERAERTELFAGGEHVALHASGAKARHAVAFVRGALLVVVPRLLATLNGDWADTALELPPGPWRNVFTGVTVDGTCTMSELTAEFPVAVFARPDR